MRCGVFSKVHLDNFVCFFWKMAKPPRRVRPWVRARDTSLSCACERISSEWRRWTSSDVQIQLKQQYVKRIMVCCWACFLSVIFCCRGVLMCVCVCLLVVVFFGKLLGGVITHSLGFGLGAVVWCVFAVRTRQSVFGARTTDETFVICVCEYFNEQKFTTTMTAY